MFEKQVTGESLSPVFLLEISFLQKNIPTLTKLKQSCVMVRTERKEKENKREQTRKKQE